VVNACACCAGINSVAPLLHCWCAQSWMCTATLCSWAERALVHGMRCIVVWLNEPTFAISLFLVDNQISAQSSQPGRLSKSVGIVAGAPLAHVSLALSLTVTVSVAQHADTRTRMRWRAQGGARHGGPLADFMLQVQHGSATDLKIRSIRALLSCCAASCPTGHAGLRWTQPTSQRSGIRETLRSAPSITSSWKLFDCSVESTRHASAYCTPSGLPLQSSVRATFGPAHARAHNISLLATNRSCRRCHA
jgi:hypothetical protein